MNEGEMNPHLLAGERAHWKDPACTVQSSGGQGHKAAFLSGQDLRQRHRCALHEGLCCDHHAKTGKELTRHPRENGTYRFKAKLRAPKQGEETAAFRRQGA